MAMVIPKDTVKRRKLAKDIAHHESVIVQVLSEQYKWPRPLISDFLHCLRKETEEA